MKQVAIITAASAAALILSLVGTFLLMPVVAPEKVAGEKKSGSEVPQANVPASDPDQADENWARQALDEVGLDSLQFLHQASLATRNYSLDSLEALIINAQVAVVLQDSVLRLQQELKNVERSNEHLALELTRISEERDAADSELQAANAISSTLTRLEDRELRAILKEVEPDVLRQLYAQAPENRRPMILRALPPAEAARLVEGFVAPGSDRRRRSYADGDVENTVKTSLENGNTQ